MRLDSHQHFWAYDPGRYGWITEAMPALRRDRLPADLAPLLRKEGVEGTIAVQARQDVEETEWLLKLADRHTFVKGVVGWVDLRSPRVEDDLARLSRHPKLVGVRHVVQDEPDERFVLGADFRRGLRLLREFSLTYDLLLRPPHLPYAAELVAELPDQPFVLDHAAKPLIREQRLDPWQRDIEALAARPNVSCKLSGLVTEASWDAWRAEEVWPYLDIVLEAFGPGRLMVGSDWPVCTLAADYAATMTLMRDFVRTCVPVHEREGVLGGNAARFYGLAEA